MAAADITAWRRQNSDALAVDLQLHDGTLLRGNLLMPRDKQLRDVFNLPEPFIDFDCFRFGPTVLAKSAIRSIRKSNMPSADQLEKRLKQHENADPYQILGVAPDADHDTIRQSYITLARNYHPDRYMRVDLPAEVAEYINAMARRVNAAYSQLNIQPNPRKDAEV